MYRLLWLIFWLTCSVYCSEKETFYLIPRTQKSCLPADNRGAFRMGADKVQLRRLVKNPDGSTGYSKVLAFPGCFELTAELEVVEHIPGNSVIMYSSFKWLQALSNADVSSLDVGCTGADAYGCGGTGNKCFYCDVCRTLKERNLELPPEERFNHECPREVGRVYEYFEERCVNDWGSMDKDKDGKPDFMKEQKYEDYSKLLDHMNIEGYGTMRLTVYLATNATQKQQTIMDTAKDTLRKNLRAKGHEHSLEKHWAKVYRLYWLPKLVATNIVACVNVYFDMCKDQPLEDPRSLRNFQCNNIQR